MSTKSANAYFFLSAVNAHIDAEVYTYGGVTNISFTPNNDFLKTTELTVHVSKKDSGDYIVSYVMQTDRGELVTQPESKIIPADQVYGVITALANDAFPV